MELVNSYRATEGGRIDHAEKVREDCRWRMPRMIVELFRGKVPSEVMSAVVAVGLGLSLMQGTLFARLCRGSR